MCILSTIMIVILSTIVFNSLWLARMGSLAHWSYILGSAVYPRDDHRILVLSTCIFSFIVLGTILPSFLFPKIAFIATALSIPPQIHMLILLNRSLAARIQNNTVTKAVQAYTAVTLISTFWTVLSIVI